MNPSTSMDFKAYAKQLKVVALKKNVKKDCIYVEVVDIEDE
jgi:hypothetical protein